MSGILKYSLPFLALLIVSACDRPKGKKTPVVVPEAISETTSEPKGDNCALGGLRVDSGIDLNGNGLLDRDEIQETEYDCNESSITAPQNIGVSYTNGSLRVSWDKVDQATRYRVYHAIESIEDSRYIELYEEGQFYDVSAITLDIANPKKKTFHYFRVSSFGVYDEEKTSGQISVLVPLMPLNDTGITWCASSTENIGLLGGEIERVEGCDGVSLSHPNQDAHSGRDFDAPAGKKSKVGNGIAGFDFTKMCNNGALAGTTDCPEDPVLGDDPHEWGCTKDNVTGLIWEVKVDKPGTLRHWQNTYSWYSSDALSNGGDAGAQDRGICSGSRCDTEGYVTAVNTAGLCGKSDWRVPSRIELQSILDYSGEEFTDEEGSFLPVDTEFLPNTRMHVYWTSYSFFNPADVWAIGFYSTPDAGVIGVTGKQVYDVFSTILVRRD